MNSFRHIVIMGLAAGLLLLGPASIAIAGEPVDVLNAWTTSLAEADHAAYLDCLHSGAQAVPEYGSLEAMRFWQAQMADLEARGFKGQFEITPAAANPTRIPPGALLARPIIPSGPIQDAIVLFQENGVWKILRLFS